jgi:NAD-dependent dihydropyrimidine dehydrogenase PreA subunit
MAGVSITERGCRGCTLCVDLCPVDVFDHDADRDLAVVARQQDCIGCLSCSYVCPSQCVEVSNVEVLRPFHRIPSHVALVQRLLQVPAAATELTAEDHQEAHRDVSARLVALADAIVEIMGRGCKPVGRRAGAAAAAHMPEMYEERGLERLLGGLERQFGRAFELGFETTENTAELTFSPCGLCRVVEGAGQTVGEAVLCEIFHEFLAGLLSEYTGTTYRYEMPDVGATCRMVLRPQAH